MRAMRIGIVENAKRLAPVGQGLTNHFERV